MKILTLFFCASMLHAGIIELLGPGSRQAARNQQLDRPDGTGQFLELVLTPVAGSSALSRVELWTSKREAGKYTRIRLQDKELPIPQPQAIARDLYDFPFANFATPNAALAENRVAILCGGNEFTIRLLNTTSLTVGRAISIPSQARAIAIRPGNGEIWVAHSGSSSLISVSDPGTERLTTTFPLRTNSLSLPVALFFSPSGRTAYAVVRNPDSLTDRGSVFVIDTASRQVRGPFSLGTTSPQSAVPSPDGSTIYVAGTSLNTFNTPEPSMTYYDTQTNSSSLIALGLSVAAEQLIIHPNGTRIYWAVPGIFGLEEFDVQARRVLRRINLPRLIQPQSLDLTPNGDLLILRDALGAFATHLDVDSGEILDTQPIAGGLSVTLFRP